MYKVYKKLIAALVECGFLGFGGGNALIPVLHEKTMDEKHLVDEREFNEAVVVSSITPGAMTVKIAAGVGSKSCGIPGLFVAAGAISLPGCALVLLITAVLSSFGARITQQVNFLSIGVSAYIMYVLGIYVIQTVKTARKDGFGGRCLLITAAVFFLTCESSLHQLLDLDMTPLFSISTVNIMAVAFFLIFWMREDYKPVKVAAGVCIALLYCLSIGRMQLFSDTFVPEMLVAVMFVMAVWGLAADLRAHQMRLDKSIVPTIKECAGAAAFMLVLAVPAFLLYEGTADFMYRGCLSSLISFGGGSAYLAVAGGMFVASGLVLRSDFYSNLVPVANALPGSFLCKILTGVGYFIGYRGSGSMAVGAAVAVCGFGCAVAMSSITYSVGAYLYEQMENVSVFEQLKRFTRPIISGLLLTVALGLYDNCAQIGEDQAWTGGLAPAVCAVLVLWNVFFAKKIGYRPLYMVLSSAAIALVCCNVFEILL